jgi:phosphatidate cytidylyltransferase
VDGLGKKKLSGVGERFLGVLVLLPVILAFWVSASLAAVLFVLLSVMLFREFTKICQIGGVLAWCLPLFGFGMSIGPLLIARQSYGISEQLVLASVSATVVFVLVLMQQRNRYAALFGAIIALCISAGANILAVPDGRFVLLALAITIASCDVAAYFTGRSIGGVRLAPKISPNKTVSGAVGGVLAAMITTLIILVLGPFTYLPLPAFAVGEFSLFILLFAGLCLGFLSQVGDLLESLLKRRFGVKDSGQIIPGHGGVLDRFDGYLLTLPALYLVTIFG